MRWLLLLLLLCVWVAPGWAATYGVPWSADTLANTRIQTAAHVTSIRFRAYYSGAVTKIYMYIATIAGYGAGNNGTMYIRFYNDDGTANHRPTGAVLGSHSVVGPIVNGPGNWTLSSPPTLVAGNLYHIVISNSDPNPATNNFSVDHLMGWGGTYADCIRGIPDTDLRFLSAETGGFAALIPRERYLPIFSILYASGSSQGQSYTHAGPNWGKWLVNGLVQARMRFTVTGSSRTVTRVWAKVTRARASTGASPLTLRLETSGGTLIEQGTVPWSTDIYDDTYYLNNNPAEYRSSWVSVTFATPRVLVLGSTYHVVMSTPAGTTWVIHPMQAGLPYGFSAYNIFTDGYWQQTSNGATWVYASSYTTNAKAQVYFDLVGDRLYEVGAVVGTTNLSAIYTAR
jgi:hypothetical protein